jgi:FemAB-related protein (PEP-CTERM system-associated)
MSAEVAARTTATTAPSMTRAAPAVAESPLTVRAYREEDRAGWNAFVLGRAEGTFFHRAEWSAVVRESFGHEPHYLLAERAGALTAVLPLVEMRSLLFGSALISTPFCVYGGVLASDAASEATLIAAACDLARRLGVDHLELRNRERKQPDWPARDLYVTFRRPIGDDAEQNMLAIPRKQRAVVRKGIKEGLRAEVDADAARHYRLYSESLRNLGTPVFSRRYLEILLRTFGSDCEVLTVTHRGAPIASCLTFYFRDQVLPYYGGGTPAARQLGGNDFLYWEIMERARQRGCRVFDFGRSKRGTGAFDFKRYWGFEPEPLHYEYFLVGATELPNLSPTNPKFERMIRLWRRLPLGVTQAAGAAAGETPRMSEILFLAHRIPYPPDKGDKIRSWHFLDGLARRHTVHLGAFVDDEADWPHERTLAERCGEVCLRALPPRLATARSAMGLLNGEPLTLPYYRDRALAQWVASLAGRRSLDAVFVFSSSMAQYATTPSSRPRRVACSISATSIPTNGDSTPALTSGR